MSKDHKVKYNITHDNERMTKLTHVNKSLIQIVVCKQKKQDPKNYIQAAREK